MWVFYRKHLKADYGWPITALVFLGVASSLLLSTLAVFGRRLITLGRAPRVVQ
jgi:hypothetical protein